MNLKHIAATALVGCLLSTSAMAKVDYKALGSMHADVQYGTLNLDNINTNITKVGFGMDMPVWEKYTVGFQYDFLIPSDSSIDTPFDIGLVLGYIPMQKLKILGSVAMSTDNSNTYTGALFGLGVHYQLTSYVAAAVEVKTGSMSPIAGPSFTETTATAGLEFNFLKADGSYRW